MPETRYVCYETGVGIKEYFSRGDTLDPRRTGKEGRRGVESRDRWNGLERGVGKRGGKGARGMGEEYRRRRCRRKIRDWIGKARIEYGRAGESWAREKEKRKGKEECSSYRIFSVETIC